MDEKTSLNYRIDFDQNISDGDSKVFSEMVGQELLNKKILFFDQWGINFCEGFLDIKDYSLERRPEDLFYEIVKSTRLFELVKNFRVVLDEKRL